MKTFALVTGASRGLGRAAAIHLGRKGHHVLCVARDKDGLEKTAERLPNGSDIIEADLSDRASLAHIRDRVDSICGVTGLGVFLHCAAATPNPEAEALLAATDEDTFLRNIQVTAQAGAVLLQILKPALSRPGRATCVCINSDWTLEGITGPPVFAASKAFLSQIWKQARVEYMREGIILGLITAGNIATYDAGWEEAKWDIDDPAEAVKSELGTSRILIADMLRALDLFLDTELAAVTEVRIVPFDPEYKP